MFGMKVLGLNDKKSCWNHIKVHTCSKMLPIILKLDYGDQEQCVSTFRIA